MKTMNKRLLSALCATTLSTAAVAGSSPVNLQLPPGEANGEEASWQNWETPNFAQASGNEQGFSFTRDNEGFEEPWLSGSKAHQYMGLGALALVALSAISPKEEDGAHEYFATGAAALAAGAATSGLIYHWEDFDLSDGITDPDNMHFLLASLGTLAMVAAVAQAPEGGHAGLGIAGGVGMGIAVKLTW